MASDIKLMIKIENYVAGELIPPTSGEYLDNFDPATGEVYSQIPDSDERDVQKAVKAANAAFPSWSNTPPEERFEILMRLVGLIERDLKSLALAESVDNGKTIEIAKRLDIPRAASNFRFYATAAMHTANESHDTALGNDARAINYTIRQPLGVVGCISPWNLPLYLFTWKIAPAIAAGCSVVAKPSEVTPMTAYLLSQLCIEAGLPAGVLNIVHGSGPKVGSAIVSHKDVKAISFTGGTKTGEEIARTAAPMFKKLSLELGGKNPNIVFADCNYDEMLAETRRAAFANQGEICLCGSRIFVERGIHDEFVSRFVAATKQLKIGDPLDADTDVGALISAAHLEKVTGYIALAKEEGGTIATGGNRVDRRGYYVEPTVITGLGCDCRVLQEEIFGPVVTITPFDGDEEAVRFANSTRYGLSATVWTRDLKRAHRVAAQLHAGTVWVNCWLLRDLRVPFGGMKDSGVGREGGFESLQFFTEAKNVCVKLA